MFLKMSLDSSSRMEFQSFLSMRPSADFNRSLAATSCFQDSTVSSAVAFVGFARTVCEVETKKVVSKTFSNNFLRGRELWSWCTIKHDQCGDSEWVRGKNKPWNSLSCVATHSNQRCKWYGPNQSAARIMSVSGSQAKYKHIKTLPCFLRQSWLPQTNARTTPTGNLLTRKREPPFVSLTRSCPSRSQGTGGPWVDTMCFK